jgi:hypothetical protein
MEQVMIETRLPDLLRDATADLAPSQSIDLTRVKTDGARRVRRRRTGRLLAAAITVVSIAGAGFVVASTRSGHGHLPVDATASPSITTPVPVAPRRFDVQRLRIEAGWVPDGLPRVTAKTYADTESLSFSPTLSFTDHGVYGTTLRAVDVTLYAAGVAPNGLSSLVGPSGQPVSEPGPTINGAPSTWSSSNIGLGVDIGMLTWRWAPNAWATVTVSGFAPARDVAAHIASTVHTDRDIPVTMPFTVAAPPAPLRLFGTEVDHNGDGIYTASLIFSDRDDRSVPATGGPNILTVSAGNLPAAAPPNTTVGGHPAYVHYDAEEGDITVDLGNGTEVSVTVSGAAAMAYVDEQAATAMARGITLVPVWTASPIR